MSIRRTVALLLSIVPACTETPIDDETGTPAADPRPTDPAPITCATSPIGPLAGTAVFRNNGSSAFTEMTADVTWTPVSTDGCVDRYQPSGTVAYRYGGAPCDHVVSPASAPIDADDGELLVDRTTSPPTYRMIGISTYDAAVHCADAPAGATDTVGGTWTEHSGAFDGALVAGGLVDEVDASLAQRWRFTRVDATFAAPSGCSEEAVDRWQTVTEAAGTEATVTWTRASTSGCVDTFTPSGTARALPRTTAYCATATYAPDAQAIGATDGTLTIDRTTSPPTFRVDGLTSWSATRTCTRASGQSETETATAGGPWAEYAAEYDGAAFGGSFDAAYGRAAWRFDRR